MIEVETAPFARALALAASFVDKRATIPALAGVKLTANGALVMEASDLDTSARVEIPHSCGEGALFLPMPQILSRALRQAGGPVTTLQSSDERPDIRAGGLRLRPVAEKSADDHPGADRIHFEAFTATLGQDALRQIARVAPAISKEETRYYLNGICARRYGEWTWSFVATDGHRLHLADIPLPDAAGDLPDMTIFPRRWIAAVLAHFRKSGDGLRLTYGRTGVNRAEGPDLDLMPGAPRAMLRGEVGGADLAVCTKLVDGTYPDYTRVIPKSWTHNARLARADLVQAIRAVHGLGDGKVRAVRLTFATPGRVTVALCSAVTGDAELTIAAEHDFTGPFTIGFNGHYLLDALGACGGDEVHFGLTDAAAPTRIINTADASFIAILMPMRV